MFDEQQIVCPQFADDEVRALARERYGLEVAALKPLGSFQDQNFKLTAADGRQFVFKIANAATDPAALDLQTQALAHIAAKDPGFPTPRLIPTLDGAPMFAAERDGASHLVRLLTFVPGQMLAHVTRAPGADLLAAIGRFAGALAGLLADFEHPAGDVETQWDMRFAPQVVRAYLQYVDDPAHRELIEFFLARYEAEVLPILPRLRMSMIHGDITGYNLLVDRDADGELAISGLVDFGDMTRSFTLAELAVAVSEGALDTAGDPLAAAAPMVAGFHQVLPLGDDELAALFDMVCLRRCVVAVSVAQQLSLEPDNAYVRELSLQDWPVLERLRGIHPRLAQATFRHACGLPPDPGVERVRAWLAAQAGSFIPPVDLGPAPAALDLSPESELYGTGAWERPTELRRAIEQRVGAGQIIGRYGEARLLHTRADAADEPDTLHLGLDLFAPAGTPVRAALAGVVEWAGPGELILRHAPDESIELFTRHAGLELAAGLAAGATVEAGAVMGAIAEPGLGQPLPAHLHFQLGCALVGPGGRLPGLAPVSQREVWLALCPDPNLILGLPGLGQPAPPAAGDLLERRSRVVHQSQEYYYARPMRLVRGWRQYLYDEGGRAYLDAINNVAHVGHCHPRVVAAAARQMALLNTNSRFLYGSMVEYAERLVQLFPEPLRVVFFVCTGSEANDLALRLARAYTRQHDVVVIDGEYHGNTTAVDEISTSLIDNPAAKQTRPWVHAVLPPNTYRGPYGADDPECGRKYAAEVERALERVREQGRGVAAFFTEGLLGSSGGIALPPGYLPAVYAAVRAAGGLCIADEVQVGFGRMGTHMWAFETQGVVPDIVTLGKPIGNGHPLSAVITTPAVAEAFRSTTNYFNTCAGNPVSCEVGMAVLDAIEQEGLQAQALAVGARLKAGLTELMGRRELIGAVYGQGMYMGVELVRDRASKAPATAAAMRVAERMRERGVIVYPTGDHYNILKIKPPLVFDAANADFFIATLDSVLSEG
jgi:4-aminobutyrate aminotransferase-like enzyme/Ser/Thr protein kinase RdoA (MazF antagonist)